MRIVALVSAAVAAGVAVTTLAASDDDPFVTVSPPAAQISGVEENAACDRIIKAWSEGDQGRAEHMAAARLQAHPSERRTTFVHATFMRSRFYKEEPDQIFGRLIQANPNDLIGQTSGYVLKLDAHRDVEASLRAFAGLSGQNPNDPLVVWLLGIECREHKANKLGAKAYEQLCTLVNPGGSLIHQTYANILDELGRYNDALPHRQTAVRLEPASWSYNGLGNTLHELGRYAEAVKAQQKALELEPDSARVWRQAARSENALGHYASAFKMATRSTELNPREYWAWMAVGEAQEGLGQPASAIQAYQSALGIDPQTAAARDALARLGGRREQR